jgi:hypothetical protein
MLARSDMQRVYPSSNEELRCTRVRQCGSRRQQHPEELFRSAARRAATVAQRERACNRTPRSRSPPQYRATPAPRRGRPGGAGKARVGRVGRGLGLQAGRLAQTAERDWYPPADSELCGQCNNAKWAMVRRLRYGHGVESRKLVIQSRARWI